MSSTRVSLLAACLCAVGAGCAAGAHKPTTPELARVDCAGLQDVEGQVAALYAQGNVQRVEPIHETAFLARAIQPRYVSGASLYVPAQAGQSEAYLERVLSCHASGQTAAAEHPNDPLRVRAIEDVDVESVGTRYRIAVRGADRAAGKEIWQRAQALQEGAGRVQVQQIAAVAGPSAAL